MNLFQKIFNKRLSGREYSKKYTYSVSFENTKLDWFRNTGLSMQASENKSNDLVFFGGRLDFNDKKNWGALICISVLSGSLFSQEEFNFLALLQSYLNVELNKPALGWGEPEGKGAEMFLPRIIEFVKKFHERPDEKEVLIDKNSIRKVEEKEFFAAEATGKIISKLKEDYSFYDMIVPFGKQILVFSALMPKNNNPDVVEDLRSVAYSLKMQVVK